MSCEGEVRGRRERGESCAETKSTISLPTFVAPSSIILLQEAVSTLSTSIRVDLRVCEKCELRVCLPGHGICTAGSTEKRLQERLVRRLATEEVDERVHLIASVGTGGSANLLRERRKANAPTSAHLQDLAAVPVSCLLVHRVLLEDGREHVGCVKEETMRRVDKREMTGTNR
jgi:hypothetical protein